MSDQNVTSTPNPAPAPYDPEMLVPAGANGELIRLGDVVQKFPTYAGKASAFEEKAAKAAEYEKKLSELEPQLKSAQIQQAAMAKIQDASAPLEERVQAYRDFGKAVGARQEDIDSAISELMEAQGASAPRQGVTPPTSTGGLTPDQLMVLADYKTMMARFEKAGIKDPVAALAGAMEFQSTATDSWNRQKAHDYILDKHPTYGRMIKDPENGNALFEEIWSSVKASGKSPSPQTIDAIVKEKSRLLDVYEKTVKRPAIPQWSPSGFGMAPATTVAPSPLNPPKAPNINEFRDARGKMNLAKYIEAQQNYNDYTGAGT
jgi:hypothetical protein